MATNFHESLREPVWYTLSVEEAVQRLNTHPTKGLTQTEVEERRKLYGFNELQEAPRPTFWHRLWSQLNDFLVLILIVASAISLVLGDYTEAAAIMAIVILNAILGVIQESRAEEALAALKEMTSPEAEVIRDGRQQTIPTRELVPGDLILLETGNYVPADVRLVETFNLKVDEASLTGESVPVRKQADALPDRELPLGDRKNTAYMGTLVTYGRGRAVVTSTGMSTQFGLIAQMVQSFESEPTPLQRKLEQLGQTLGIAALAVCGLVFAVGVLRSLINPRPGVALLDAVLDMFIVSVSLAIAAVPEGLPAVVTICLALGMRRMVQSHALLRQLAAVEALGSATVICSDKTGTLTQNAMTVVRMWVDGLLVDVSGRGYTPEGHFTVDESAIEAKEHAGLQLLLQIFVLCNDAYLEVSEAESDVPSYRLLGDPTEGALVVAGAKGGCWRFDLEKELPRLAEIPFDSGRKRMTTIHRSRPAANSRFPVDTPYVALIKGAPDVVLDMCTHLYCEGRVVPLTAADRRAILQVNEVLSSQALRVLGGATKGLVEIPTAEESILAMVEHGLIFVGLAGMIDPPRPQAGLAVTLARQAGIKTVMITGDYPKTAEAVAREIGLLRSNGRLLTGRELDALDDETFAGMVEEVNVFARLSPQHKVRIVKALQSHRHIVSMTGDGVNDAPALKKADIGVAMGIAGTDVSKEAAEMVLTDDNFSSIVSAIEEGRVIYSNIRKFVFYLLSCNVGEILIIFVATLLGWPLPLTAIHLLVLNLVTDGAPALALGLEKGDPDVMDVPPRDPDEPVIDRPMMWRILVQAIVDTVAILIAFRLALYRSPGNIAHAQTMAFVTLSVSELFRAYTARSERYSLWRLGFFGNRFMQYAVATSLLILLAIVYVPALDPIFGTTALGVQDWLMILPLTLLPAVAAEITKKVQFGRRQAVGLTLA